MARITKRAGEVLKVVFPVQFVGQERTLMVGVILCPSKWVGHGNPKESPYIEGRTLHVDHTAVPLQKSVQVAIQLPQDMPLGDYDVLRWVAETPILGDPMSAYQMSKQDDDWDDDVIKVEAPILLGGDYVKGTDDNPCMVETVKNGIPVYYDQCSDVDEYGPLQPTSPADGYTAPKEKIPSDQVYYKLMNQYGSNVAQSYMDQLNSGTAPSFYVDQETALYEWGDAEQERIFRAANGGSATITPDSGAPSSTPGEDPLAEQKELENQPTYTPPPSDGGDSFYYIPPNYESETDQSGGYVPPPTGTGLDLQDQTVIVEDKPESTSTVPEPAPEYSKSDPRYYHGTYEATYNESKWTKWRGWAESSTDARKQALLQAPGWSIDSVRKLSTEEV